MLHTFKTIKYVHYIIYNSQCHLLSTDGHSGCVRILAIINNSVNTDACTQTVEYYSAIKNELLSLVTAWMSLKGHFIKWKRQRETYNIWSHLHVELKNKKQKKPHQAHRGQTGGCLRQGAGVNETAGEHYRKAHRATQHPRSRGHGAQRSGCAYNAALHGWKCP